MHGSAATPLSFLSSLSSLHPSTFRPTVHVSTHGDMEEWSWRAGNEESSG